MKTITLLLSLVLAFASTQAQNYLISFVATGASTTLDSVKVENLTQVTSKTFKGNDTLHLKGTDGISNINANEEIIQVYPNPMQGQSEISFYAKNTGNSQLTIYDISGKEVLQTVGEIFQGIKMYRLTGLRQGVYFVNISGVNYFYTAKLISLNISQSDAKIEYLGSETTETTTIKFKNTKATVNMAYTNGDSLRFTGYSGIYSNTQTDVPISSKTITFTFTASLLSTVLIPAGTFAMGSPISELSRDNDEAQYEVTLSAFSMSKYEITNAQYATFLNSKNIDSTGIYTFGAYPTQALIYASSGSHDWGLHFVNNQWIPVAGYENHPVIFVTWFGSNEFAIYAGGRLPSEAEWEYACRGNTNTQFNTDTCLSDAQANYWWLYPYGTCINTNTTYPNTTQAVGTYSANAFGLFDMHGNVFEWCNDWYGDYPTTPQTNPEGPTTGLYRIGRGGSWYNYARNCRSAYRGADNPATYTFIMGFRVVLVP